MVLASSYEPANMIILSLEWFCLTLGLACLSKLSLSVFKRFQNSKKKYIISKLFELPDEFLHRGRVNWKKITN